MIRELLESGVEVKRRSFQILRGGSRCCLINVRGDAHAGDVHVVVERLDLGFLGLVVGDGGRGVVLVEVLEPDVLVKDGELGVETSHVGEELRGSHLGWWFGGRLVGWWSCAIWRGCRVVWCGYCEVQESKLEQYKGIYTFCFPSQYDAFSSGCLPIFTDNRYSWPQMG